ncbi:hypothetical protein EWM64_g22 [Hericium alpestre]|uniref:Amino acid permease/ SLC12A domain-containing protein n=1 Tax=Hericium alpestre TaxID=135208 RepID=A0A4Z0ACR3_9AGAM|nr:hypothetical protein EWM64_g22 [Hericium alpestre]
MTTDMGSSARRENGTWDAQGVPDDDRNLEALGYVPSFKREFSNLATLCVQHHGASIAEIVSAFPTCGGLYTASAQLVPKKHRPIVGWTVGWLNILGQVAGLASTEFGLSNMIWAAVVVAKDGDYAVTDGKVVGLFAGLLIFHGILNCLATRYLARFTTSFVFVNLGATLVIVIVLLATTPRHEMHSGSYVFGSEGVINQTGGWNNGLAFLFGLLSVQWTMTDYDATAHISEEVKRAAYAAPAAIFVAVIGTGLGGWLLNIVLVLCSGPFENLPGPSNSAFLEIMALRMGKPAALFLWTFVCLTAFFVSQTALQACSRTVYAFSRDHGLPDGGYFGHVSQYTLTPLRAIWFTTIFSILPGLLQFASPVAANAIFSLTAIALDLSYIIPIFFRRVFQNHPEVQFTPGPFYMGDGLLGWAVNVNCILWTLFVSVIFSLPTVLPVTKDTMNYASVITGIVIILAGIWYIVDGRRHYHGPASNVKHDSADPLDETGTDEVMERDSKKSLS